MKKILAMIMAAVLTFAACPAMAGETSKITGNIEDGCYILTVNLDPDDAGEWRADEMAQDDSVVRLAASGTENGVFTARYEPTGDGEVCVNLRHFNGHACDELHSFNLLVKDGRVEEATGGSYTASPDEWELDSFFSGEWLEKGTQFTVLDVTKRIENGWDVEITSPVSHGAWVIRATVYYDCDYDAFVYADGVKYDLIPGDETMERETAAGLWGTLRPGGTEDSLQIVWSGMEDAENREVIFERAPALPAYSYTGDDPVEGAVANELANGSFAKMFLTEEGAVTIPCPILLKKEMTDETHAKVYGSFWVLNYVRRGEVLHCISGGEFPGIALLEKTGDEWRVTDMETAGDGEDYAADIGRFANGDAELEEKYFAAADLMAEPQEEIRTRYIREYAEACGLAVTAYKAYGWDAVPLK